MFSSVSMKARLVILGLSLSVLPIITYLIITIVSYNKISTLAAEKTGELARADLNHIVENLYNTCIAQHGLAMQIIENALKTSENILTDLGDAVLREDKPVKWEAINQYTKAKTAITLPAMYAGDTWLGQNSDMNVISPVVDKTRDLSVETCTIFQRMNDKGDMLRVVTNVKKLDGKRAIGTFIPAANPNGSDNPVVSAVLKGTTFLGRAFVVNAWYLTAYKPLYDKNNNVIGILYVGIQQKTIEKSLAVQIKKLKIGTTGNVYVLNSKGEYIIEPGNKKLPEEKLVEIISETKSAAIDETTSFKFPLDSDKRDHHIIRARYFKEWDWIICVNVSENELMAAPIKISEITKTSLIVMGITAFVLISLAVLFSLLNSTNISKKLLNIVDGLSINSNTVSEVASLFSQSSRTLAEGSTGQTASIEGISSSMEEMSAMTKKNAENSSQADNLMKDTNHVINTANESMDKLTHSMEDISKASEETSKIIKTIDEIAFQTNLLALNAAVEAARAGEAGAGFAVVADEVRNLAMRAAKAAKDTEELIKGTVKKINDGTLLVSKANEAFGEVGKSTVKVGDLVSEISQSTNEQSTGIEQVKSAITEMDSVIQQNAAKTEETTSGSKEMNTQAEHLREYVGDLMALITGKRESKAALSSQAKKTVIKYRGAPQKDKKMLPRTKEIKSNKVIPFDDEDDFENF